MKPLTADFARLYDGLRASALLEKMAEALPAQEATEILLSKLANDNRVFEQAKIAFNFLETAGQLAHSPFGKGLGYAAGAAIPATVAMNAMSTHAAEEARNKALQTGAGLAGIGATLYGLHHAMSPASQQKHAADEERDVHEALEKLASIGYLDELLSFTLKDSRTGDEAKKLAGEIKLMNQEYAVSILRKLMG